MVFLKPIGIRKILPRGILIVFFDISAVYLLLLPQQKLFYFIDDYHLARVEPKGTWSNMTCPLCGLQMEQIVIDSHDPQTADDPWRYAYYCEQEDLFWVADMPGWYFAGWYGPYNAYWKLTNAIATFIVVVSSVSIIVLTMRTRKQMITNNRNIAC